MSNITVLAIDDQEDNVALLQVGLEAQGLTVHGALDGRTGLALARSLQPDLILLDIAMPGLDGFEVLEVLRADAVLRAIPVIILTANFRDAAMIARGFALGATEYLTKPIKMDELHVRIETVMRLVKAEKEVERLRRDFASMLVHDMRSPLDGARLVLAAIQRQEPVGSSRAELLALALSSLEDVGNLIENLLDVNRLEEEGFAAPAESVELGALVAASVRALRPIAEAHGLLLRVEPQAEPLLATANPRLLRRVLDNLLANALKFVEAGEVVVTTRALGDELELAVSDTGPGIAPEVLPCIFDRYFHFQRRQTARSGGMGLGLAFCQRAVTAMGGQISVSSVEGRGTTFSVRLPRLAPAKLSASQATREDR